MVNAGEVVESESKAAEEKAAKAQAANEKAAKAQATKEKAAAKEMAAKEMAAKAQTAKEKAAKETAKAAKAKAAKEKARAAKAKAAPRPTITHASTYSVTIRRTTIAVNAQRAVQIRVDAKNGYKVNLEYPHSLSLNTTATALTLGKTRWTKKDARYQGDKALSFGVPVRASMPGRYPVTGKIKFSVCNADACLLRSKTLSFQVTATAK